MDTKNPFPDHESLELHLTKLRVARDTGALRLESHWKALGDRTVRGKLLKNGLKEVMADIEPLQMMKESLSGGGGMHLLTNLVVGGGGWKRRLFTSLLAVAAPKLLAKVPWQQLLERFRGNGHAKAHDLNTN